MNDAIRRPVRVLGQRCCEKLRKGLFTGPFALLTCFECRYYRGFLKRNFFNSNAEITRAAVFNKFDRATAFKTLSFKILDRRIFGEAIPINCRRNLSGFHGRRAVAGCAFFRRGFVEQYWLAGHALYIFVTGSTAHILMRALQRKASACLVIEQRRLPARAVVALSAGRDAA